MIFLIDNKLDAQFLTSKTFEIIFEKTLIEPSPRISILSPFATITYYFVLYLLKLTSKFSFPVM
jgi:hypothetical protein